MSKDLIIVESPAKVKTIKKFLGARFEVEASVGHVRDLPRNSLGVDEQNDFAPQYTIIQGKEKVVERLKSAAKRAEHVYLAPDPDREGEAIAWHVAEIIKNANTNVSRIQFNEITPAAVKRALAEPRELNRALFDSQQARRVLDRLVGYKLSPLLWNKVKRGISAGRVQSVALKLIVDREKERLAFVSEEYWVLKAVLKHTEASDGRLTVDLYKVDGKEPKIGSAAEADAIEARTVGKPFFVTQVTEKERKKSPPPPFITSTLQQAANQRLGWGAKRTMGAAQKLYEGVELGDRGVTALITYMRTDSTRIADEARDAAKAFILQTLGEQYYPPKPRYFKSKASAQDAHEAVRPVDPALTPESLKPLLAREHHALFKLVWERFMASQAADARFHDTTVTIETSGTAWRVKGERMLFPGYLALSGVDKTGDAPALPKLEAGDALDLVELKKEQKFTQPPPRFTEASLVRELEEKGIGRPSTYAAIISTLLDREYAALMDKHFVPSDLGTTVSDLLSEHFSSLMDVTFTAAMEEALDGVAEGGGDWVEVLKKFNSGFVDSLALAQKRMASVKAGLDTDILCEKCGSPMKVKFGKAGQFLACSGWPACKNTKNFLRDEHGVIHIVEKPEIKHEIVGTCPECGGELAVKKARTGSRFIACLSYPKCSYTRPYSLGVPCPKDGCVGMIVEKSSKKGKIFYGCDQWPKCDWVSWDAPTNTVCPDCGKTKLLAKTDRRGKTSYYCPDKDCGFKASSLEGGPSESPEALLTPPLQVRLLAEPLASPADTSADSATIGSDAAAAAAPVKKTARRAPAKRKQDA